jgi:hypothetical protein
VFIAKTALSDVQRNDDYGSDDHHDEHDQGCYINETAFATCVVRIQIP